MRKMNIDIWSQWLLSFCLSHLCSTLCQTASRTHIWGEMAWIAQPWIIPDVELSEYKSLLPPSKSTHSPGLTIWLSTWFCIKSSIFCFTRVLVSHGDSWSHSWPVCPNAKNSLSEQARQKARQQMLLPRGTACALTARMCSAPLQGSSSAGFADVVSRAPKLQLLFQQWNLLHLHPNFLLPDLLGHLLREEQTLPQF